MLTDWIYWLSYRHPNELVALLWAFLLVDSPRYAFSKIGMCVWDIFRNAWRWLRGNGGAREFSYCPSVAVLMAGYNEEAHIEASLQSVWGSYPRLEIIVVDDGSSDRTLDVIDAFARTHPGVLVLHRDVRGGRASAINFALAYATSEVIIIMDTDSHLGPSAIWEVVQPLQDPKVGAVSATVLVRDPFRNVVTWLQAYEYLQTIFVGRMVIARLGILGIVSGGFGAFRHEVLERCKGYDVGPDEDADLTTFVRKAGYEIAHALYAECYTGVPQTWSSLWLQRLRWDLGELIRNCCRKHVDVANPRAANFRLSNLLCALDTWMFRILFQIGIWLWIFWLVLAMPTALPFILLTLLLIYYVFELLQAPIVLYYSLDRSRDALVLLALPLVPVYQFFMFLERSVSIVQEVFWRKSFELDHVPERVRKATWRW